MPLQEEFEQQGIWLFKYRSFLPLIILFVALAVYLFPKYTGEVHINNSNSESVFLMSCIAISLLGLLIRIYTVGHTPKNTSGRNTEEQVADELNTTGIYSLVRHPLYVGNFFMWLGPALFTANIWFVVAFCFLYIVYYERIMFAEEQFLRRKFGANYTDWASEVSVIFPSFKNFKSPKYPFSWKKVIRQEKNGFASIFVVFAFFSVLGDLVSKDKSYNLALVYSAIISLVIYFILKYLKRQTTVLQD